MKYTARHIRRFLDEGKIDAALWKNHFPGLLPSQVPVCKECSEFKERTCAGGREPVACFLAKDGTMTDKQKPRKRDPMLGLGARGPELRKTAQPRDQSKM
jgi:hypothetical protein